MFISSEKKIKSYTLFILTIFFSLNLFGQEIKIGNQVWMSKNLNVSVFRNGDPLYVAKNRETWEKAWEEKIPACCYYENNSSEGKEQGLLYNLYAVTDPRGIAPIGWRIPNDNDWREMCSYLGESENCGKKLKSKIGWDSVNSIIECTNCKNWSNEKKTKEKCEICYDSRKIDGLISGNGDNSSGFNAYPTGCLKSRITFDEKGEAAQWWSESKLSFQVNKNGSWNERRDVTSFLTIRCVKE